MKENWELAYEDHKQGMKRKDIAEKYGVSINTVKSWKTRHWNALEAAPKKRKKGAPPNNKNALNNQGGAPPKNKYAEKHGFFSKWLPEETMEIFKEIEESNPLDLLWVNIQLQYAAILRAQKLMYVNDREDKTITLTDGIQQAWDKQANFMSAQSRAMKTLESMIKQYDEMLHKNWKEVTEEQKARIELLKLQTKNLQKEDNSSNDNEKVVIINDLPK